MATTTDEPEKRQRLKRLAWVLDSSIRVPGTRFRFGVDSIIGLVPGIGDAAGALLSSYILAEGFRMGASRSVLLRMAVNIVIEVLVGTLPLVGDLFDMAFKANNRNVRLLEEHLAAPARASQRSRRAVWMLLVGLAVVLVAVAVLGALIIAALIEALTAA